MDSVLRMTAVAALLSSFGAMLPAHAGLGPIRVLSAAGEPFLAEIPLVDESINANALIGLADRNRYPLITPYSPSVGQLQFSLMRQPDGMLSKVHIAGPANFDEATLRFAVEISWPAGRLVREFEVDYRRDGPRHPKHRPLSDDEGKKAAVTVDHQGRLMPLGLGALKVQSFMGEPLLAEVELLGRPNVDLKQLSAVVLPNGAAEAQQAQLVASIGHEFVKSAGGKVVLRLYSSKNVEDPILPLRLEVAVGSVKLARNYSLLFYPPDTLDEEVSSPKKDATTSEVRDDGKGRVYLVAQGDTLGAIAQRTKGGGSVEEVIRRLHAANPHAFIAGDVNKLKAGARLVYPSHWHIAVGFADMGRAEARPVAVDVPAVRSPVPAPAPAAVPAPPSPVVAAVPAGSGDKSATSVNTAAREEQLKRRLQQQDQLLAAAEHRLELLQQRVKALQQEGKVAPPALPKPGGHKPPEVSHPGSSAKPEPAQVTAGPETEVGVMDSVSKAIEDNPFYLYGAGAAGVALLGGGLWLLRRRNARENSGVSGLAPSSKVGDSPSLLTMGPLTTLMAGGKQGAGMDLSPVDLVAEAEVYLAYGRTDQALALLREGLVREPMRQDVRFKLLEALSSLPDRQEFVLEATTAKGIFGKDSTLWQRVCELGRVMLPDNPLFNMPVTPVAEGDTLPSATAAPPAPAMGAGQGARVETPASGISAEPPVSAPALPGAEPLAPAVAESDAPDKRELARLYMEMGDTEAANALLKESKDSA